MSFRSRMLIRNHLVTASHIPVFEFDSIEGISVFRELNELKPRLMVDFTTQKMMDSGLPLPKFTQSPDTCTLFDTVSKDMDLQVVSSQIESLGYSLDKPLSAQNGKKSSSVLVGDKSSNNTPDNSVSNNSNPNNNE